MSESDRLECHQHKRSSRLIFYMLQKVATKVLEGLHVNKIGLQAVKDMLKLSNDRVVLIPMYKSSADPFILHFI